MRSLPRSLTHRPLTVLTLGLLTSACDGSGVELSPTPPEQATATPEPTATALPSTPTELPSTPTATPVPTPTPSPTPDPATLPCEEPLTLGPTDAIVAPFALLDLAASGGTGDYLFELETNASGALLNELTGVYLAGELGGVSDVVSVSDSGCIDVAQVNIQVAEELELLPSSAELPPLTPVQLEVAGGSGQFSCALLSSGSGASLDPSACLYTAGPNNGNDLIRVTDERTGQFDDALLTVSAGAVLRTSVPRLYLPEGASFTLKVTGGSGYLTLSALGDALSLQGAVIQGVLEGGATVTATDDFTGQTLRLPVTVVGSAKLGELKRMGEQADLTASLSPGDLNGDGFDDVIFGAGEVSTGAYYSGAVYVYHGRADGPPVLAQTLPGTGWDHKYGSALALADFDGDGLLDLAVGARDASIRVSISGAVYLYAGQEDGTFESTPFLTLAGTGSGDRFGHAVTTGDYNGDGWVDLAVSANNDENNAAVNLIREQGAIHLFLGNRSGYAATADQILYGVAPDGLGGWADNKLKLAYTLASGDFDGDGLDDLMAGCNEYDDPNTSATADGALFLYTGLPAEESFLGGLTSTPTLAWTVQTSGNMGAQVGGALTQADLDQDGRTDIVVAVPRNRKDPTKTDTQGAVHVLLGRTPDSLEAGRFLPLESEADWSVLGLAKDDILGWRVRVADATGDGLQDLLLSTVQGEITGGQSNAGTVEIYAGLEGAVPETSAWKVWPGLSKSEQFGSAFEVLPDRDADGIPELAVFSNRDDSLGTDVGRPFEISTQAGLYSYLEMPSISAGQLFGFRVAVLGDVHGDGYADLLVGAMNADIVEGFPSGGAAYLFRGTAQGFARTPEETFTGYPGYTTKDQNGYAVASAGDFNGDGAADLAVLSRSFSKPSTFDANLYANPTACAGSIADASAVLVYLGKKDGSTPSKSPAFVYFGAQASDGLVELVGDFDYNQDGKSDLLVGAPFWEQGDQNDAGAALWLAGRAADSSGKITVICAPDLTLYGRTGGDRLGDAVGKVGDVDGDGCAETAVGAYSEDLPEATGVGTLRVVFGWGGDCASTQPRTLAFSNKVKDQQVGMAVAGGADIDGDSFPDVVASSTAFKDSNLTVGGVWLVRSGYMRSLTPSTFSEIASADGILPMTDGVAQVWKGSSTNENFGVSVTVLPGMEADGRAQVAVGSLFSDLVGTLNAGNVRVMRFDPALNGPSQSLVGLVGGETSPSESYMGNDVSFAQTPQGAWLVTGAPRGNASGIDTGSTWLVRLVPGG